MTSMVSADVRKHVGGQALLLIQSHANALLSLHTNLFITFSQPFFHLV